MRIALKFLICISLFLHLGFSSNELNLSRIPANVYQDLEGTIKPKSDVFDKAYLGYIDLKLSGYIPSKRNILTLVDFRLHANTKRLWVIDLDAKKILFHTYVAHGENSGQEYALDFSNQINSHKSSLGFYVTEDTYQGKNGLSLRLKGLEHGFNHNARERYIVLHGADYATSKYIKENGLLGNSEGCPAVPMGLHKSIIEKTKGGTCLFIFFPDANYLENSNFLIKPY